VTQAPPLTKGEELALLPLDDPRELSSDAFLPVRIGHGGERIWAQTQDGREYYTVFDWEPLRCARCG